MKKLSSKLQARLDKANSKIVKNGGEAIPTFMAIDWNLQTRPQSGYDAGEIAIGMTNADSRLFNRVDVNQIGNALVDISREMSGVDIY